MQDITNELQVTSLDDLVQYSKGTAVRLPDFAAGQPFVARLKRPSLLALIKSGKIPNTLLTTANKMFMEGGKAIDTDDENSVKELFGVVETICDACFVAPTYQEIKDSGMGLTDDQLMFVFNYTQQGVKALDSFRKQ